MSDLLEAQTMFQQSHDKYVEAYAQFRIKIVEYRQAIGDTEFHDMTGQGRGRAK